MGTAEEDLVKFLCALSICSMLIVYCKFNYSIFSNVFIKVLFPILTVLAGYVKYIWYIKSHAQVSLNGLRLLVRRCSSVNRLNLYYLDQQELNIVGKLLGDVTVSTFRMSDWKLDEKMRFAILMYLVCCEYFKIYIFPTICI